MVSRVGLNSQPLRTEMHPVKNASVQSSRLSFGVNEDDEPKDKLELTPNNTDEPISDKKAATETQPSEVKKEEPARKFSFNKALQNFGDGFIYPIRQAFNSVTNAAVTLTSLVVVKNLLKKVPELGKPLVAITAGLGLYNIGKGLIKIVQNKNNPESQEKSFFDIGKGTAITALAGKCANNALNAGKDASTVASASKVNWVTGILNCAKETPAALMSGYRTISNNPKEILGAVLPALPKNIKDGLEALSPGVATATDINIDGSAVDPNVIGAESVLTVVQDQFQKTAARSEE